MCVWRAGEEKEGYHIGVMDDEERKLSEQGRGYVPLMFCVFLAQLSPIMHGGVGS